MKPLFVDLDGTLLFNDSVQEVFYRLLFKNPWQAIISVYLLITQGRMAFKDYLASHVSLSNIQWQLNPEVIKHLKLEKARGRKLILLTASHETIAKSIVEPLGLFDQIVGSTAIRNFKGRQKLAWIQKHYQGYDYHYAGNSNDDYVLWQYCDEAVVVNPSKQVLKNAENLNKNLRLIQNLPDKLTLWQKSLRTHQYSKNFLIFIPLLLSGNLLQLKSVLTCIIAWIGFSALASVGYLLNDLVDTDHDRKHSHKKSRPIAAGHLNFGSISIGILILLALSILICSCLPMWFSITLIAYFILTMSYSFFLKRVAILDVFVLSALYIIRIAAGSAATGIIISHWLFAFALFFFLSLAYLKRFIEIEQLQEYHKVSGRNYLKKDRELVKISGISLGFLSILIFALYLNSNATVAIYQYPNGLWLVALALLYWLSHLWHAAVHEKVHNDPIEFALRDKVSILLGLFVVIVLLICQGWRI